MTLFILYLLALLDGILCGLRTAMGRQALIRKRWYYVWAIFRGLAGAQLASTLALGTLIFVFLISPNSDKLRLDLETSAERMLQIFLPYAGIVLGSLALRALPSTDIRSATSVFVLGPLTALRPLVMIAGVAYGIVQSRFVETRVLGLIILGLMLSLEYFLNRWMARRQAMEIQKLVPGRQMLSSR